MEDWVNRFSLTGRRALVTGATMGIGFEACGEPKLNAKACKHRKYFNDTNHNSFRKVA